MRGILCLSVAVLAHAISTSFDCNIRKKLLKRTTQLVPRQGAADILEAAGELLASDGQCSFSDTTDLLNEVMDRAQSYDTNVVRSLSSPALTIHVDPRASPHTSPHRHSPFDFQTPPTVGSAEHPVQTIHHALAALRAVRASCLASLPLTFSSDPSTPPTSPYVNLNLITSHSPICNGTIVLAPTHHFLHDTVTLTAADSYTSIISLSSPTYPSQGATVSGAVRHRVRWQITKPHLREGPPADEVAGVSRFYTTIPQSGKLWPLFRAFAVNDDGSGWRRGAGGGSRGVGGERGERAVPAAPSPLSVGDMMWAARYPNGNPTDIQPVNYAAAAGQRPFTPSSPASSGATLRFTDAAALSGESAAVNNDAPTWGGATHIMQVPCDTPLTHIEVGPPIRNVTPAVFPVFGRDYDPRSSNVTNSTVWLHIGAAGTVDSACAFEGQLNWWTQSLPGGMTWNGTGGRTDRGWPLSPFVWDKAWPTGTVEGLAIRAMHIALWGSHRYSVASVDPVRHVMNFSGGGWQTVSRVAGINTNAFYMEGPCWLLDSPGEVCFDIAEEDLKTAAVAAHKAKIAALAARSASHRVAPTVGVSSGRGTAGGADGAVGAAREKVGISNPPGQVWPEVGKQATLVVGVAVEQGAAPPSALDLPALEVLFSLKDTVGVTFKGVTLERTSEVSWKQWAVPSPGDWAIRKSGAVVVDGGTAFTMKGCTVQDVGGNGVFITGASTSTTITDSIFRRIGESAIMVVGTLAMSNGVSTPAAAPDGVTIDRNAIRHVGTVGKQNSAVFVATACGVEVSYNVLFDGPRAGVNINDGYCGDKYITDNVMFGWVRETQDHGPINTWDRAAYIHPPRDDDTRAAAWGGRWRGGRLLSLAEFERKQAVGGASQSRSVRLVGGVSVEGALGASGWDSDGSGRGAMDDPDPSNPFPDLTVPAWNHVSRNFIYNGPGDDRNLGNLFPGVDNDDGSSYYTITRNIIVAGGFKNFLGNDKEWDSNFIIYPNKDNHGVCLTHWAGANAVYSNNTCVTSTSWPMSVLEQTLGACDYDWRNDTERALLPATSNNVYYTASGEWAMGCNESYQFTLAQMRDLGFEEGSSVAAVPFETDLEALLDKWLDWNAREPIP